MTREEWLNAVAQRMAPWFEEQGHPLPSYRVTCGFPSQSALGQKNRRIGECWDAGASEDKHAEIFVSPVLDKALDVAQVLCHELIHAAVGVAHGHKGPFPKVARALGLEGKMTATTAGPLFVEKVGAILAEVGEYPHARLNALGKGKKQTTRMIKCVCPECGYVARTTKKWLDEAGAPHCPTHGPMDAEENDEDSAREGA